MTIDLELIPTRDLIAELRQRETMRFVAIAIDTVSNPPLYADCVWSNHLEQDEAKELLRAAYNYLKPP